MSKINWGKLSPLFTKSEFDHPDKVSPKLLRMLHKARKIAGVPFIINSDYRTSEENRKAGGKANSAHLRGLAIDISCETSGYRYRMLRAFYKVGFRRIGEGKTFLHVDVDESLPQDKHWRYD